MGTIRRRAAAVLLFIDMVTQRIITGSRLLMQIRQKSPVIWKEEGYAVIMEQVGVDSLDIFVSGAGFAPASFHMDIVRENPLQVQYVCLLPSGDYPFTQQMAVIHGTGLSKTVYAVRLSDAGKYRLMENIAAGESVIRLWGAEGLASGQRLLLEGEGCRELITLHDTDNEAEYGYCLREKIHNSYMKGKAKIYSVIRIDSSDEFWIAYDNIHKDGEKIRFLNENSVKNQRFFTRQICADAQIRGFEGEWGINMENAMEIDIKEGQKIDVGM